MKIARLLHNPEAGEGSLTEKHLVEIIESAGYDCSYSSTKKKGWEKLESKDIDFLILAGGDGTVRKVAEELLDKKLIEKKLPIGLLPLGTANNIARTLGIKGDASQIINSWNESTIKNYDVGRIYGLGKTKFFLEGFGYGIFPSLMKKMKGLDKDRNDTQERNLKGALETLLKIIERRQARYCKVKLDDKEYSGNLLLAEILNTSSIGPNLILSPSADPGDGKLDVVLIAEDQRNAFTLYVENKLKNVEEPPFFTILKTKNLDIFWDEPLMHVDDEYIKLDEPAEVRIELLDGLLQFLVPEK